MGIMRFDLGLEDLSASFPRFSQAFISNYDGAVFPTRVECNDRILHCIRQKSDSGKLNISWPVEGYGCPTLRTTSLIEREQPYLLALELARGQLCELRDQAAAWSHAGMLIPEEYAGTSRQAHQQFVQAVFAQDDPAEATRLANSALQQIFEAEDLLANSYSNQRLQVRRQRFAHPPALFGCDLGPVPVEHIPDNYAELFDSASISLNWKQIESEEGDYHWDLYDEQVEWALKQKTVLKGGPLLSFAPEGLPGWLSNWKHDILNLQSFLTDYIETAVSRYTGKIRIWEVVSHMNTGGIFDFSEENLLALTARMIDVARQVDGDSQIFVRVDRPWGDYQSNGKHRLTPWHVVDALLRSGMGMSGLNLELAIGYANGHNDARRLLRFSKLLDTWGTFGIPLHVTIACPSAVETDINARPGLKVDADQWKAAWSEEIQAQWADDFLKMMMAKQPVVGIYWSHLNDTFPHRFPHAGIMKNEYEPKAIMQTIAAHRGAD